MDEKREKWWQLRLRNVLLSVPLFGASFLLLRLPPPFPVGNICVVMALAIGILIGKPVRCFVIGLILAIPINLLYYYYRLSIMQ